MFLKSALKKGFSAHQADDRGNEIELGQKAHHLYQDNMKYKLSKVRVEIKVGIVNCTSGDQPYSGNTSALSTCTFEPNEQEDKFKSKMSKKRTVRNLPSIQKIKHTATKHAPAVYFRIMVALLCHDIKNSKNSLPNGIPSN
jgi:hypothetical protein